MLTRIRMLLPAALALALPVAALAQAPNKDANDRPVEIIQAQGEGLGAPRVMAPAGAPNEPVPSFRANMGPAGPGGPGGGGAAYGGMQTPPPMPPNAWPSYAPYNNYSRVAYPNVYPSSVNGQIGPIYPFPKAPLGWRCVTLSFDDGHWYLASHACNRDWWTLRYW